MEKHLAAIVQTIRQAKNNGRHDGLGEPIIGVDLYQASALNACDEIERLQAIVAKLPQTADGVPILPGQKVWGIFANKSIEEVEIIRGSQGGMYPGCYSTREAAEAAQKGAE